MFNIFLFNTIDTHLLPAAVVAAGQGRHCGGAAAALQGPDVSTNVHHGYKMFLE